MSNNEKVKGGFDEISLIVLAIQSGNRYDKGRTGQVSLKNNTRGNSEGCKFRQCRIVLTNYQYSKRFIFLCEIKGEHRGVNFQVIYKLT